MATKKRKTLQEKYDELDQLVVDIWNEVENCDGSRASQMAALDAVTALIEEQMPEVADREPRDSDDDDEDDDSDDDDDDE